MGLWRGFLISELRFMGEGAGLVDVRGMIDAGVVEGLGVCYKRL